MIAAAALYWQAWWLTGLRLITSTMARITGHAAHPTSFDTRPRP